MDGNPFDELASSIAHLESRVAALEAWRETHTVGMNRRQQTVDATQAAQSRDRWLRSLRGRR